MIKLHRLKSNQAGFTGIEVLIVLVIVAIVALLVVNNLQSATAESRDIERRTDINGLQTALESHWHTNESLPDRPEQLTSELRAAHRSQRQQHQNR